MNVFYNFSREEKIAVKKAYCSAIRFCRTAFLLFNIFTITAILCACTSSCVERVASDFSSAADDYAEEPFQSLPEDSSESVSEISDDASSAGNSEASDGSDISDTASGNSSVNADGSSISASGSFSGSHIHSWKAHTVQKKVTETVTVVDEPEKTVSYSLYRMYWYNTGEWEETRDPERFQTWMRDREGGQISPDSITMAKNPEDCPLFKGYDENGHASFTNDHTIISGLYETIPAVTHEETRTRYETYTDYYYCDCGAVKK